MSSELSLSVPCPLCRAAAGRRCTNWHGRDRSPHGARANRRLDRPLPPGCPALGGPRRPLEGQGGR